MFHAPRNALSTKIATYVCSVAQKMTGKEELQIYCYLFFKQLDASKCDTGFIEHIFGEQGTLHNDLS